MRLSIIDVYFAAVFTHYFGTYFSSPLKSLCLEHSYVFFVHVGFVFFSRSDWIRVFTASQLETFSFKYSSPFVNEV